jgi:hypothetical protein
LRTAHGAGDVAQDPSGHAGGLHGVEQLDDRRTPVERPGPVHVVTGQRRLRTDAGLGVGEGQVLLVAGHGIGTGVVPQAAGDGIGQSPGIDDANVDASLVGDDPDGSVEGDDAPALGQWCPHRLRRAVVHEGVDAGAVGVGQAPPLHPQAAVVGGVDRLPWAGNTCCRHCRNGDQEDD